MIKGVRPAVTIINNTGAKFSSIHNLDS